MRTLTKEEFVSRAQKVHGSIYDYTEATYVKTTQLVRIGCGLHGIFEQRPVDHMRGQGCPRCGKIAGSTTRRSDRISFIDKAKSVHGNKYNYDKVIYTNTH